MGGDDSAGEGNTSEYEASGGPSDQNVCHM
jgi:hypothetical protein